MKEETKRLEKLTKLAGSLLPNYEIRGVFRLIENTPAGPKVNYVETDVNDVPIDNLFGGVLLACPKGDRTNGYTMLEISTRDNKIFTRRGSSRDAILLQEAYLSENEKFELVF